MTRPLRVRKQSVTYCDDAATLKAIDQLADTERVVDRRGLPCRAEMIRILTAYALRHRPAGWRP